MAQYGTTPRPGISKWWCISFFIAAIVFFIIGGALLGVFASNSYSNCSYSSGYSYYSSYSYDCVTSNMGEWYGGIAMLALGGVCKFIGWVLLIVFCVKRRRFIQNNVTYVTAPAHMQPVPQPSGYVAPQPTYPVQPNVAEFPHSPASPAPYAPSVGTPPPKEATATAFRYCRQCGTAISSRFCPQCGTGN